MGQITWPDKSTGDQVTAANMNEIKNAVNDNDSNSTVKKIGFIDYGNSGSAINLTANTWTDVPNNGLGAFTNKTYKPDTVSELMDSSTGYLDFSDLTLGSQVIIRSDFTINPQTNNALLEARYQLGTGAGTYELPFLSERLDVGSGVDYKRVRLFDIYMGDNNTLNNAGKLQVRLSSSGTLNNSGWYILIIKR